MANLMTNKKHYRVDDGETVKKIIARTKREAAEGYALTMQGYALVAVRQVGLKGLTWFPMRGGKR
jgi:hypothetical protein